MYYLYDYYEGKQLVGKYNNHPDLLKAKKQYVIDTDGECDLEVEFVDENGERW